MFDLRFAFSFKHNFYMYVNVTFYIYVSKFKLNQAISLHASLSRI